jgi:hypothetical protein
MTRAEFLQELKKLTSAERLAGGVASCILTFGRNKGDANLFLDRMKGIGEGKMYRESFPPG